MVSTLKEQFTKAFQSLAQEGIDSFKDGTPVLSHVCFKFKGQESYQAYVAAARELGQVSQEEFNGKQITWCKLKEPLKKSDLTLHVLELVEPKEEKNAFDGVTSIGYSVADLSKTVKQQTKDANVIYRYQSQHASEMAKI